MRRPADPEHDPIETHITITPGWRVPPHCHPGQTEEFAVLTGTIEVLLGGSWRTLKAGQSLVIPPGSVHTYRNRSGSPARAVDIHSPAGHFSDMLDRTGDLEAAGLLRGPRGRLFMAMVWTAHEDSFRLARAPARLRYAAMAAVGRAAGLKLPDLA